MKRLKLGRNILYNIANSGNGAFYEATHRQIDSILYELVNIELYTPLQQEVTGKLTINIRPQ